MSLTMIKILLLVACFGHVLCCFFGVLAFSVALFVAVVSGATGLPRWACVFNTLPIVIALFPFKIVGSFNVSSAAMFLGLFITLCLI